MFTTTIVSAYYEIKSKFDKDKYLEWGKTFMKLESPIILFTEKNLIPELKALREDRPIEFIVIPFENIDTWELYKDKWQTDYYNDPEKIYHTPELYAIWAQKAFFVERAITLNTFNTNYFFWCDFGAFRNPNIDKEVLNSFPTSKYFSNDKIILQAINDLTTEEQIIKEDGIYGEKITDEWNEVRLVGGLWGGSINACINWKNSFKNMLEKYILAGRFAGKDQIVMLSTYLENPELANIVKCTKKDIDEWFFLEYLLSNNKCSFNHNESYIKGQNKNEVIIKPTVSCNIKGGLGNQLFQIATAYAYAKEYDGDLKILREKQEFDGRPLYWNSILHNFKKYTVDKIPESLKEFTEKASNEYSKIPELTKDGIFLNGYFQTEKYFNNPKISNEIKTQLRPSDSMLIKIYNRYKALIENRDRVIVIHARRTDYLKNSDIIDFHGPLTEEYYTTAISKMCKKVEKPIFLLSADDNNFWLSLITKIPMIESGDLYILNEEDEVLTFYLLQQFSNFIISNSTFIWWIVWLAENVENIIAPSKWFGPKGPQNYKDTYCANWNLI
jgi:hypothetical protein